MWHRRLEIYSSPACLLRFQNLPELLTNQLMGRRTLQPLSGGSNLSWFSLWSVADLQCQVHFCCDAWLFRYIHRCILFYSLPYCGFRLPTPVFSGFPCGSAGKESACNEGDLGLIPELGRSPGKGEGYPLWYSGLENSTDYSPWGHKELDTTERLSLSTVIYHRIWNTVSCTIQADLVVYPSYM